MAIKVDRDPDPGALCGEHCFRCFTLTAFWYTPADVACCPECAKGVTAADVPTKTAWCEAVLAKFPRLRSPKWTYPRV